MAEKRDFLDDLIDIQSDWRSVRGMPASLLSSLVDESSSRVYDPADYKEKPFANSSRCLRVASGRDDVCSSCLDACPVDAITIHGQSVILADSCRKCGLCAAVCPTETFATRRHTPRQLYERVARAACSHNRCYVTCTRALGRLPFDNEVLVACVGMIPRDLWFALLADFSNVSVYLPVGVCDRCRNTTGEGVMCDSIAIAEEWARASLDLVVDESELDHEMTREYKRSQFVSGALRSAESLITRTNPVLAGAQAVARRIMDHSKRLDRLQRQLEEAVGSKTSANRQRVLTQPRKLMMGSLQRDPGLASYVQLEAPVCDSSRCTLCGECTTVCTPRAIDLDARGQISVQAAFCVGCGACVTVCEDKALAMEPVDMRDLVVHDHEAEEELRRQQAARERSRQLIEAGKRQADRVARALEKLADDES